MGHFDWTCWGKVVQYLERKSFRLWISVEYHQFCLLLVRTQIELFPREIIRNDLRDDGNFGWMDTHCRSLYNAHGLRKVEVLTLPTAKRYLE